MILRRRAILAVAALALAPGAARAGGEDVKKRSRGVSYIPLDVLTGATSRADGRRGVLTVECGLDIPDGKLRARAESLLPRLRAAYLQMVMIYAAGLPPGAPPNADYLAQALQRETDQQLGRRGARLLLGAILVN